MFSELGPLFKTTFRRAEENDVRLNIPHDERDKGRKKREDEKNKEDKIDLWRDDTSVTVTALRQFLINFLKTIPGGADGADFQEKQNNDQPAIRPKESKRPTNTKNAKAVRAYQAMAKKGREQTPPTLRQEKAPVEPTADLLHSRELRDIHSLIQDLDMLKGRGIQDLRIMPADSFLISLRNAVEVQKSKI